MLRRSCYRAKGTVGDGHDMAVCVAARVRSTVCVGGDLKSNISAPSVTPARNIAAMVSMIVPPLPGEDGGRWRNCLLKNSWSR